MNKKTAVCFLLLMISCFSFSQGTKKDISSKPTVYVFLTESCPICQSYTLTLKTLYKNYGSAFNFIGVFPNSYSTKASVDEFKKKYSIPFETEIDKSGTRTKHFRATITPEVFVEDKDHKLLYRGRIDDSFYALGKRRNVITSNDLQNALAAIAKGDPAPVPVTQAVGCIITSANNSNSTK